MTDLTPLDHALANARRGWRVAPIPTRSKHPRLEAWQENATCDAELIVEWWAHWPTDGIGIVCGAESGLFVLDVDPAAGGDDSLADLEAEHGPLPDTVEVLTGGLGRHIYFAWPEGVSLGNSASRLGPGLDIRADGGQVVAPPSVHHSGRSYEWEVEHHPDTTPLADAPAWLIDLIVTTTPTTRAKRERAERPGGTSLPGDRFAAAITWPELLEADGATYLGTRTERTTATTYELWSRPPMPNEVDFDPHTSATLYYKGSDVLKVFTGNWGGVDIATGEMWKLDADATYTRFGYFAARYYNADHTAAAAALHRLEGDDVGDWLDSVAADGTRLAPALDDAAGVTIDDDSTDVDGDGWEPVDWATLLADGYEPPKPTILDRSDGRALFYAGRVNGVHGESGAGKSWVAFVAVAAELAAGRGALYIDLEDHPLSVYARLALLGVSADAVRRHLIYINPERAASRAVIDDLVERCEVDGIRLAVIDSVGEAMAVQLVKQNDDDEVARWFRHVPRRLAASGAAVVVIDHVPKSTDANALYAIGSQRKRAAIDGAAYRADQVVNFSKDKAGTVKLVCAKDRNGAYAHGEHVADVHLAPDATKGSLAVVVAAPAERDEAGHVKRPTVLMERVSLFLEHDRSRTGREIENGVKGKGAAIRNALAVLVEEGYVTAHDGTLPKGGKATWYSSAVPYRDDSDDPLAQAVTTVSGQTVGAATVADGQIDPPTPSRPVASPSRPVASRDATDPSNVVASPASPLGTEPRDAGRDDEVGRDTPKDATTATPPTPYSLIPADHEPSPTVRSTYVADDLI